MSQNKSVSVIVPVYNTEKYVKKCIESLLKQTLENIEIIIVNDGSPDNSQLIIDEIVNKYPDKVKSFIKENGGLGSARNYGLQFAKGEYIGYIDSDDYVKPDMFEKMYKTAKNSNADLVICNFDFVDENGNLIKTTNITSYKDLEINNKKYALTYGRTEAFNKLYHRDLFFKTDIRYPKGWFEDYATTPLLIEAATKIVYVEDSLMCYVQREGSIMNETKAYTDKYFDILKMTEIIIENKEKFNPDDYDFFMDRIAPVHVFLKFFLPIIKIKDYKLRNIIIKKWGEELNRLIPKWYISSVIKNRYNSLIKKFFFKVIVHSFRTGKTSLLNLLIFLFEKIYDKKG